MAAGPSSCLLIADFTIGGLATYLASPDNTPVLRGVSAGFDQVVQTLLDRESPGWQSEPEAALVWTRPNSAIKSFGRLLSGDLVKTDDVLAEVDVFAERLKAAAGRVSAMFVPTWTWPSGDRGLGVLNMSPGLGPAYHLMRMNARLAESLAEAPNVYVLDAGRWVAAAGSLASSPKLWHLGKIAFGPEVLKHAAADIKAAMRAIRGQARKLVVLDLDDTLWGGIVGDMGWRNLKLGGHDPLGEAFCAFQRALKALTRRGIVLGIVSKNTESIALEAIDCHPEMALRRSDFAGWRINWRDKAENLAELAAELNLGLESIVFIDDNPVERARVREAWPQVFVPEWPTDKLLYEQALSELCCFDAVAISDEDSARTRMYRKERERRAALSTSQSLDGYLASLDLQVSIEPLGEANLTRATQLLNKTNQMNLVTRRLAEREFQAWADDERHRVYVFRVADRFDDYGLTGIGSLSLDGHTARVCDFVLSCRVIGRGVEQTLLYALIEEAKSFGMKELLAELVPTPRNAPCQSFFEEQSGWATIGEGTCYAWSVDTEYAAPSHITFQRFTASNEAIA